MSLADEREAKLRYLVRAYIDALARAGYDPDELRGASIVELDEMLTDSLTAVAVQ